MNVFQRIAAWHRRVTFTPCPYLLYWNQYIGGSFYGWGRVCTICKAFETAQERDRFCKKLYRRPDFAGIIGYTNLKGGTAA